MSVVYLLDDGNQENKKERKMRSRKNQEVNKRDITIDTDLVLKEQGDIHAHTNDIRVITITITKWHLSKRKASVCVRHSAKNDPAFTHIK